MRNRATRESGAAAGFRLRGVQVVLGDADVLRDLDLRVEPGESLSIVGPSGAGKTTLLRLFNATVLASRGSVEVDGGDLGALDDAGLRALRSRIGFVHQDHFLVPNLRVCQNVVAGRLGQRGFWAALRSMLRPGTAELEEVHAILERVGIPDKLFQRTASLSGGERQRVAVARALFQAPRALIADEPVASLDPARARSVIELLCRVAREEGLTLVAGMHDLALAREYFPRCVGLRAGRIQFDRPTREVPEADFERLYRLERQAGELA